MTKEDLNTVKKNPAVVKEAVSEHQALEQVNKVFKVRLLGMGEEGFIPKYTKAITFKEAFVDFDSSNLHVISEAVDFLCEYIEVPENDEAKRTALNKLTIMELMALFGAIMGKTEQDPPTGAG